MIDKKMLLVFCISVLLTLASSPLALAGPSWAKTSVDLRANTYSANVINLVVSQSQSTAYVQNPSTSVGGSTGWLPMTDTDYSAVLPLYGSSKGSTESLRVYSESLAEPLPGAWSQATSWWGARQTWTFDVSTPGVVSFDFDLTETLGLQTGALGEAARGMIYAEVRIDSGGNTVSRLDSLDISVFDGVDFPTTMLDKTLGVSGFFLAGPGTLTLNAGTQAYATAVVPVPAGVLLGFLGLSAAGLGLRKLA